MKKLNTILAAILGSALALLVVDAQQAAATTSLAYASSETAIGGWNYAYTGDAASNGDGVTNWLGTGKMDGTFTGSQRNQWDGSAPGEIGAAPTGNSPGGFAALSESGVNFLRMQDTWDPTQWSPTSSNNWTQPSNSQLLVVHETEQDVSGSGPAPIMSNGLTFTFRARISSTGTLDNIYKEGGAGTFAWPAGGRGPKITGSASTGLINVGQGTNGVNQIAFTLLKTNDILFDAPAPGTLTGGLYMNNKDGTPGGLGTEDLNNSPSGANFVPIDDADLLDWREFWITIDREDGTSGSNFSTMTVTVYMDGSSTPAGSFAVRAGDDDDTALNLASNFSIGTGGGTAFGAADIDFLAYNLGGAFPPVAVPEPATMALMLLSGLAIVALRRRQRAGG